MTEAQCSMCRWIAYSKRHLQYNLSYKLLLIITEQLEKTWRPTSLTRDEADMLTQAFTLFSNYNFKRLAKIRECFPTNNQSSIERLEQFLTYERFFLSFKMNFFLLLKNHCKIVQHGSISILLSISKYSSI